MATSSEKIIVGSGLSRNGGVNGCGQQISSYTFLSFWSQFCAKEVGGVQFDCNPTGFATRHFAEFIGCKCPPTYPPGHAAGQARRRSMSATGRPSDEHGLRRFQRDLAVASADNVAMAGLLPAVAQVRDHNFVQLMLMQGVGIIH